MAEEQLVAACNAHARRSGSMRYRDSPELLALVMARRLLAEGTHGKLLFVSWQQERKPKLLGCKIFSIERRRGIFVLQDFSVDETILPAQNSMAMPTQCALEAFRGPSELRRGERLLGTKFDPSLPCALVGLA